MKRREVITLLGGTAFIPLAARAQDIGRTYRIGALHLGSRNQPFHDAPVVFRRLQFGGWCS